MELLKEQKVMWIETDKLDCSICINFRQWNQLKKKIDEEFDNEYGSCNEVRIYNDDEHTLNFEGHCYMNRKRKK